jgi:uncharacterized delta-60 repeat protein
VKGSVVAMALAALALTLTACGDSDSASTTSNETRNSTASPAAAQASAAPSGPPAGTVSVKPVPLNSSAHDRFMAITAGADGKTYAAGFITENGDQALAVARLDANGALDKSFGKDGIASVNVAPNGKVVEIARAVIVQSTGKIVIAGPIEHDTAATGDAAKDTDIAVARFDTSGKLDSAFGKDGVATIDLGTGKAISATAFVGDNTWGLGNLAGDKIVLFGSKLADGANRNDADFVVVGLTSTGALDSGFGAGGKVVVDMNGSGDNPRHLLVQADGKIMATGYSNIEGVVSPVLIRLNPNGVLDSAFGRGGIATAKVLPGVAESYNVSMQGNDYIIAGYGRGADTAEKVDLTVERFKADGTWDMSFGTAGLVRIDIAKDDDRARTVQVLPDGRILAIGSGKRTATNIDAMLVMLSKDGAPVAGFGENGILISDLGGPADAWYGVTLSQDKKQVIVAGYKGTDANSGGNDDAVVAYITL